ncbi:Gas vesicle protein V [Azospirillum sp. SYSU D00513]|uniref:Gas vesicle protein V n=1 Tax=Azospirillum sp. SYSU D00513 TaxID=2812561 RepID=UPI001A964388|nr:Gas vesicle protein V [Azospirillum sp. SYSU D00513]
MSRYEEKVYRVSKGKGGPSIAEMKNQLARLKQDLEQFQGRGAGAAVQSSLQSRIRELQTSLSEAEAAQARRQQARRAEDDDDDGPRRPQVQATSSRFPPRGTTGGS